MEAAGAREAGVRGGCGRSVTGRTVREAGHGGRPGRPVREAGPGPGGTGQPHREVTGTPEAPGAQEQGGRYQPHREAAKAGPAWGRRGRGPRESGGEEGREGEGFCIKPCVCSTTEFGFAPLRNIAPRVYFFRDSIILHTQAEN